jgi:hypothetical protein
MIRLRSTCFVGLFLLIAYAPAVPSASAAPILLNWGSGNPNLVYGPDSVSQTVDGITVTARGFTIEFGTEASVFGPFPTSTGIGGTQIFGAETSGVVGQTGLGLLTQPVTGVPTTVSDFGCGLYQPGIDSHFNPCLVGVPSSEFVLFSFSQAVDVATVVVDDTSNFSRNIWAAAGNAAPDFSGGFFSAFAPYAVVNSYDDFTDGFFEHVVDFENVTYLAVGATLPESVGPIGPFDAGGSQFYIAEFGVSAVDQGGQNGGGGGGTVPEPSTMVMLALGCAAAFSRMSRRLQ